MSNQTFFYETPHANYGVLFSHDELESELPNAIFEEIKAKADALNESNKNIYRVVAQLTSDRDGIQIFIAPHLRYSAIAADLIDQFKFTDKAYIKDKFQKVRQIRKSSFVERMEVIVQYFSHNRSVAIEKTIELIKSHYEKDIQKLTKAVDQIADDYNMGTVKHQTYYAGLAETWLQSRDMKAA